jgi:hypothetical protein
MSSYCTVPEFYTWSEPVARKQHVCVECSAPIMPGEKHFAYRGKWDGLETGRQHLLCCEACMVIRDELNGGECICFGGLKEQFREFLEQCDDKRKEPWKRLRSLMARILWRERQAKRA